MSARQVDAVILDLGNVLVFHDNALLIRRIAARAGGGEEAEQRLAEALSGPLSEAINRGALDAEGIRREVSRVGGGDIPMPEFFELWSSHFTPNEAVFPRVEALAREVPLVLLSNTNVLHWEYERPRLPILDRFRAFVLSHEVGVAKPDAAIYQRAAEAAGVPPARAAFFDDVPIYVESARALGFRAYVFLDAMEFDRQLRALGLA
ncbi:MAG TPA: HAD family phosphatase [Myxococcaceae bacterium]|nr:HAD family phosphatase [Myxococcaceae bacterium]